MAPANVTVHTSRMPFLPRRFDDPLGEMERHVGRVFEEAASARPDIIAYGCTASSAKPDRPARRAVSTSAGIGKAAPTSHGSSEEATWIRAKSTPSRSTTPEMPPSRTTDRVPAPMTLHAVWVDRSSAKAPRSRSRLWIQTMASQGPPVLHGVCRAMGA